MFCSKSKFCQYRYIDPTASQDTMGLILERSSILCHKSTSRCFVSSQSISHLRVQNYVTVRLKILRYLQSVSFAPFSKESTLSHKNCHIPPK